jgi:hypothetical protein
MTNERETFRKKFWSKNGKFWVEVERTKRLTVKRGKGLSFQSTVYEIEWPDDEKDDSERDIRFVWVHGHGNADGTTDDPNAVGFAIVNALTVKRWQPGGHTKASRFGSVSQKTRIKWENANVGGKDDDSIRKVHIKDVTSKDGTGFSGSEPNPGDDPPFLSIQVIDEWTTKRGRGSKFQKTVFRPSWPPADDDDPIGAGGDGTV